MRLRDNDYLPEWREAAAPVSEDNPASQRVLRFGPNLTQAVIAGEVLTASYDTRAASIARDFESIRIARSLYTTLGDIVVVNANAEISAASLQEL